jgi:hypothetical protein
VPSELNLLTALTTCRLNEVGSANRFCCPLPKLPGVCTNYVDDGYTFTLTCNRVLQCDGSDYNSPALSANSSLIGTWTGHFRLSIAVGDTCVRARARIG